MADLLEPYDLLRHVIARPTLHLLRAKPINFCPEPERRQPRRKSADTWMPGPAETVELLEVGTKLVARDLRLEMLLAAVEDGTFAQSRDRFAIGSKEEDVYGDGVRALTEYARSLDLWHRSYPAALRQTPRAILEAVFPPAETGEATDYAVVVLVDWYQQHAKVGKTAARVAAEETAFRIGHLPPGDRKEHNVGTRGVKRGKRETRRKDKILQAAWREVVRAEASIGSPKTHA